jgi:glutamate:Na+ symporter, ESS family
MNLTDVAIDIATVSFLLFLGFALRVKIAFFRRYFIPASLIAGILGLLLGPQVLGEVSPVCLHYSKGIGQWINFAFCFIFSTSFLGNSVGKLGRDILSTTVIAGTMHMMQILVGLGIILALLPLMPDLPMWLGLLPVSGFYGGHGSAGIIGASFGSEGIPDAMGIAMTYATIGMFAAVIGGMFLINYGASKGWTTHKVDKAEIDKLTHSSGLIPKGERPSMAAAVCSPSALDPFAFQFMIVGVIIAISYLTRIGLIAIIPFWKRIPLYTMCLLMGAIVGPLLSKTKWGQYIDRPSMKRISGLALEYMIVVAVATIRISVLKAYFVPILISTIILCGLTAFFSVYLSKRWYGEHWFEVAMGIYGQCTGTLATGLLLIKVLDPDGDTMTSESISGSSTLGSFYQLPNTTMGPMLFLSSPLLYVGGVSAALVAFALVGILFFRVKGKAQTV